MFERLFGILVVFCFVGAACGPASTETATPTWTFRPSATPLVAFVPTLDLTDQPGMTNPTAAAMPIDAAVPFAVNIPASDGLVLRGRFYAGPDAAPGVLLLHMEGHDKDDWNLLAPALQEAGFAALAVDLRGHGQTGGGVDWIIAQSDVSTLLAWLHERPAVDSERVAAVGAGIGANLALVGCAADPWCRTVVLLSPGLDYQGVRTEPEMAGVRSVLAVASAGDSYAVESIRALGSAAAGIFEMKFYENAGYGIEMFNTAPALQGTIVEWLREYLAR